jgi:hypothetical protein
LVQAFLKKWWVESDFKAPNLPLSLRFNIDYIKERCLHMVGSLQPTFFLTASGFK